MATPNKFKFYIYRVILGVPTYYKVVSGAVTTTTTKEGSELEFAPDNWDEIEKAWSRSKSMHGIMNKLSNEYKFFGDGGTILKYLIFTEGYDAKARLLVEIRKDSDWLYETYSDNDIKFSLPKTDIDGVSVELFDEGIASDFMANLDTPYEIPLTGSDVITVEHEGTQSIGRYNYRYGDIETLDSSYIVAASTDTVCVSLLMAALPSEGRRPVAAEKTEYTSRMMDFSNSGVGGNFYGTAEYDNFLLLSYQNLDSVKVNYKATIRWGIEFTAPGDLREFYMRLVIKVIVAKPDTTFRLSEDIYVGDVAYFVAPSNYELENINISGYDLGVIDPDERIYIVICPEWAGGDSGSIPIEVTILFNDSSDISFDVSFVSEKSDVQGFRLHKLAEKTVEAFADGKYGLTPFSSSFLSSPSSWVKGTYPYQTIITNGNALKGISGSVFKLAMKDIIDDVQANYGLGVGVSGNQLELEPISTFYDDSVLIADLGELTDVEITPINEIPTLLVFGNKYDNDNDVLNGAYDYNTKSTFKSPNISDLQSKREYVSPIISSIYNIERLRVNEQGKDTTGNKVNEDLYKLGVVSAISGGKYKLQYQGVSDGGQYKAINTLNKPYNVDFSPKNMVLRQKEIINSNAYPSTSDISFQKSDRYKDMESQYYDIGTASFTSFLKENEGFAPDGTDLVWLPFEIKCKVIYPMNLDALLTANPYGKFKGTYKGVEVHFYLYEAKQKPSSMNSFEMTGRLTPSTNILDLIF